ncbi:hypothetical protein BU25DRAFT_449963 [Macroventuria anomochaeta]|uniref:Uncharacterized protein n=1 Tax=Macroventuria anomochaeta TaxID=301207 RepID=A0ACB6RXA0_9PLEO|nr:uncharacterized protein BU25DRAFT_449963 [Macroventuria anomochaeta]KAF2625554.1 hypothetical protein BU25DRAFT_449963 [Macroventuria anomochaeta]
MASKEFVEFYNLRIWEDDDIQEARPSGISNNVSTNFEDTHNGSGYDSGFSGNFRNHDGGYNTFDNEYGGQHGCFNGDDGRFDTHYTGFRDQNCGYAGSHTGCGSLMAATAMRMYSAIPTTSPAMIIMVTTTTDSTLEAS